jgi:hypothetical protein
MTEPLTPPDCDLQDFASMFFDVRRLLTSVTWIEAAEVPRLGHVLMCLWAESWHQRPAASLPDNDAVLARLAMCDLRTWRRLRDQALKGWILCSDGRWYHPVVAEKALEAWTRKESYRDRTAKARAAKEARKGADTGGVTAPVEAPVTDSVTEPETDLSTGLKGRGRGRIPLKAPQGAIALAVDAIWEQAPPTARSRSSRADVRDKLDAAVKRGGDLDRITVALATYYRSAEATKDGGAFAKGIHRMIENDRWRDWHPDNRSAADDTGPRIHPLTNLPIEPSWGG